MALSAIIAKTITASLKVKKAKAAHSHLSPVSFIAHSSKLKAHSSKLIAHIRASTALQMSAKMLSIDPDPLMAAYSPSAT